MEKNSPQSASPALSISDNYLPHLDGLRAIAVYLVVAFHAGIEQFSGGFIGVDIFFVLSGYLVTGILVRDLKGPDRRIGFGRFYSRRARRLLPAAAVNLMVTAIIFGAIAPPIALEDARKGIQAASLYYSNWHFIAQSADYFAADVFLNPVQHYWSLSVEEQFYVLWPVLLTVLYALARRFGTAQSRIVQGTIFCAAVASYVLAQVLAEDDLSRAYYGTDTRAYQLFAGALLAFMPTTFITVRRRLPAVANSVLSAGLVSSFLVLASPMLDVDPITRGFLVTIVTCGLIILLGASTPAGVCRVLSQPTLVYLGQISYGTYLWHWLIILVLVSETDLTPVPLALVAVVLATAIASLSYQLIEQPIRTTARLDQHRQAVLVCGLAISVFVGLAASPTILRHSDSRFQVSHHSKVSTGGVRLQSEDIGAAYFDFYDYSGCTVSGPIACPIVEGGTRTAIVVGESHASMLSTMLGEVVKRHDFSLYAGYLAYCPWTHGIRYDKRVSEQCFRDQDDLFNRILPELNPDIVFLAHRPVDDPQNSVNLIDRDLGKLGDNPKRQAQALQSRINDLVRALRADGRTVVLFEPIPVSAKDRNPLTCLSKAETVDECRFVTHKEPGAEERAMRELAANDAHVISVDLDRLVCPYFPICDPIVDGLIVMRDDNHLTMRFAKTLANPVDAYLIGKGVFEQTRPNSSAKR